MKKIILASASPRRREILTNVGADFIVEVSDFDERKFIDGQIAKQGEIPPALQTEMLAYGKAKDVYEKLTLDGDYVVIGVDTSVVVDKLILGKPNGEDDAVKMLMTIAGRKHQVISGYAVIDKSGRKVVSHEVTDVYVRAITEDEARRYVRSEYVLDKAGAYAIQGKASLFIEKIEGDYFNVVGFPLYKIANVLNGFGIVLI